MKRPLSLNEIQNYLFDILKYIRDVCDQNGLRYYLAYGTLIGAVRHQGFVPWDDDADIHMPREDYEKFVRIVTDHPHPYYRLVSRETSRRYNRLWPRVFDYRTKINQRSAWIQGVPFGLFVDIFILDGAGSTKEEAEETYRNAYNIYKTYRKSVIKLFTPGKSWFSSGKKWLRNTPERLLGFGYWADQHIRFCKQKAFDEYSYVGALGAGTRDASRNVWKRDCFGEGTAVIFNGETFRAPADWDSVLRPEYGDYMIPPPQEEQLPKHKYTAYMMEKAIKETSRNHGQSS